MQNYISCILDYLHYFNCSSKISVDWNLVGLTRKIKCFLFLCIYFINIKVHNMNIHKIWSMMIRFRFKNIFSLRSPIQIKSVNREVFGHEALIVYLRFPRRWGQNTDLLFSTCFIEVKLYILFMYFIKAKDRNQTICYCEDRKGNNPSISRYRLVR